MERIKDELVWLGLPSLADEFVGGETFQGLQSAAEVVGCDEVVEMLTQLLVIVVVIALDGRFLDGAVHPFDLPVGPWMIDLGEAMLDAVLAASHVEHVGHVAGRRSVRIARCEAELDAIIGEHGVDFVGNGGD